MHVPTFDKAGSLGVTPLTRRAALTRVSAGAFGLTLATSRFGALAQEATPVPGTPAALPPLLAAWEAAMATHDPDQILALYTADALWEEVALNVSARGGDEIRAHLERVFAATPDITYDLTIGFVAGDRAAAESIISGSVTGNFPGLPPATGQQFSVRAALLFEFADGKIARYTEYWDAYAFLVQLGALPAPGTPTP
jgi:steroid delta-isomerase-like uncharacterized protein